MNPFTASYKKYTLIFKQPARTSRGALTAKTVWFIRLIDRRRPERVGLGECAPWPGLSPDDRPDFETRLAEGCAALNRGAPPADLDLTGWPALAFGLETARLDWQGGGVRRLFAADFQPIPVHGLIWMGSPAEMQAQLEQKIGQGHTCLKLKIGALDFETECAVLANLRRRYPADRLELRLDANGAFSPDTALARLTALARFDVQAVEQPLPPGQQAELAELCAVSPVPIALDEELIGLESPAERRALLETIRPRYVVLKPTLLGGLAAAEAWIALAEALGIGWWANSALESNIGLNALAQWVNTHRPATPQGLGTGQLYRNNLPGPLKPAGGTLTLDPGLAWEVSELTG